MRTNAYLALMTFFHKIEKFSIDSQVDDRKSSVKCNMLAEI